MNVEKQADRGRQSETAAPAPAPSAGLLCPRCSAAVRPGKKFCSQCGTPVGVPIVTAQRAVRRPRATRFTLCPECGFENHHSDRFCKGCGSLLLVSPPQPGHGRAGSHSDGSKGAAPAKLRSALDLKPAVPAATLHAAAVREAVAGLNAIVAPEPESKPEIDSRTIHPVDTPETNVVSAPAAPPTADVADSAAEPAAGAPTATPATQPEASPDRQDVKSRVSGGRGLGLATASAMLLVGLVLFSTRHEASRRSRPGDASAAAFSPAPASAKIVEVDATAGPERTSNEHENRSSVPSRDKINAGKAQKHKEAVTRANIALPDAPNIPAAAPEIIIARLNLTPTTSATSLGMPQPPALKVPPDPSAAPQLSAADVPPAPQPDPGTGPAISATVAALPVSALSSAETDVVRVVDPAANPPNLRVGGAIRPAKLLAHPSPAYPPDARDQRIQGTVHVIATVRKDGRVGEVRVASGNAALASAATHAVRQWRFQAALLNGQPVQSQTDVAITFHLAN